MFLLDEPLSNLDAKLRAAMRTEITKIHKKIGTTFVYVTHDQVEAMTMATRIVVMKDGIIQQVDTPQNLYDMPVNIFVAGFIGTPQMNFINCTLVKKGDDMFVNFGNVLSSSPLIKHQIQHFRNMQTKRLLSVYVRNVCMKILRILQNSQMHLLTHMLM